MMQEAGVVIDEDLKYSFKGEGVHIRKTIDGSEWLEFDDSMFDVECLDSIILSLMHIREQRKEK